MKGMKKVVAIIAFVFMCSPAMAFSDLLGSDLNLDGENKYIEMDSPYLIEIAKDTYLGTAVGKNVHDTGSKEGWYFVAKISYLGTLFGKTPVE